MTTRRLSPDQVRQQRHAGEYLGPGVWVDRQGALHFSVPEILAHFGVRDTPAERERVTAMMRDLLRAQRPDATIIVQDEGEDG